MDLLSHAVLGTAASQTRADRRALVAACMAGALAPDLDLLIRSASDPLLFVELHRQFTHSLVVAPLGALGVAVLVYALLVHGARRRVELARLWTYATLGYVTHVGLDACTSYGVELFWPLADARPALSIISVFDPLFTLPLAGLAAAAVLRRRRAYALAALVWGAVYLGLAAVQAERAEAAAQAVAERRGHEPARLLAIPSFANTLVWKTLYEHDGRYYVDAIRAASTVRLFAGESVPVLDTSAELPWLTAGSRQARDLERFREVSNGWLALDPDVAHRVVELRYSLVPNRIAPYWALELDPEAAPGTHARFVTTRERRPEQGLELLDMVLGRARGVPID